MLAFGSVEHIAVSCIDYDQISRLVCSVCYKELVYEIPLHDAKMPAKYSPVCHMPLRSFSGCNKRHPDIFTDKVHRFICDAD